MTEFVRCIKTSHQGQGATLQRTSKYQSKKPGELHQHVDFATMVQAVDDGVGLIRKKISELGLAENTVTIFHSDNGGYGPVTDMAPLKGYKGCYYEGGIRVPLIARWPGKIQAGQESDLISAHWDMLPTFCQLTGAASRDESDGISLVDELMGKSKEQKKHDFLYWEFYAQGGKRAVRFGDWKAVQLNVNKNFGGPIQLYHLPTDLGEEKNVAAENEEQVTKARAYMKQAFTPSPLWEFASRTKK